MKNKKLHHIKSTGFKIPEDYFESLESKVFSKTGQPSILSGHDSGFTVPKQYFETIEQAVISRIEDKPATKVRSLFTKKAVFYASSIAATIILLLNLSIFDKTPTFDTLTTETVEDYLIDENVSSYEIASLLLEEELETGMTLNVDDDALEAYLLEHADIETLMIE
ncbi:hypothetical protein KFZ70_07050 [Tamlana fucoidanivorans]|uniref:Uncharacterized protein n=1 Tax=Allotamlana fucoidanivorans TaxID=2583814 RepID=A0A5C4SPA8_9FLAO|nr:hypothetical protein [Tamlana fucoidanivorans]TNJ45234.1 hypothetical protein FGF67_05865 [Tamlana fucoidanivorans]